MDCFRPGMKGFAAVQISSTKRGQIIRLHKDGWGLKDIAVATGVSQSGVRSVLKPKPSIATARRKGTPYVPYSWFAQIAAKSGGRCVFCGCADSRRLQHDHITPRSKGGEHSIKNLQLACTLCNTSKGNRDRPTWMLTVAEREAQRA